MNKQNDGDIIQRRVADDVSGDVSESALRRLVNLNSGPRPNLRRLASVFDRNKRLIQKVKWPNGGLQLTDSRQKNE